MWRRTYLLLAVLRFFFALYPSYLHPDEHFQGPEVIAGLHYSISDLFLDCTLMHVFLQGVSFPSPYTKHGSLLRQPQYEVCFHCGPSTAGQ